MLKFTAVDFDDCVGVGKQNFCGSFNYASLAGTCRAQEEHRTNRTIRRIHAGQENLVQAAHPSHRALLSNNARTQTVLKVLCPWTFLIGVKKDCLGICCFCFFGFHLFSFPVGVTAKLDLLLCKERSVATIDANPLFHVYFSFLAHSSSAEG